MAKELFPPEDLLRALHSPFREVRLGAIRELSGVEWLHHEDTVRAAAARRQLEWRAGVEDDPTVKGTIYGHLGGHRVAGGEAPPPRPARGSRRRDRSLVGVGAVCGACATTLVFGALTAAYHTGGPPKPAPSPSRTKPAPVKPVRHVGPPPARPSGQPLTDGPDGQSVRAVAFSPAGDLLATGASGGTTVLWNVAGRQVTAHLADTATQGASGTQGVTAVAYNPAGTQVAAADQNGYIYVWNSGDQPVFAPLHDTGTFNGVRSVAFSPDGRYLATGDGNGDVYLWSAANGTCLGYARDPGGQPSVTAVAFSPDSAILAAGDAGGSAYLWDAAALAGASPESGCAGSPADLAPAELTVPDGQKVTAVAFSPDGKDIATGDADGNTYVWNAASHQVARTLTDQGSAGVSSVAFSENSAVLATGDGNGKTYLWYAATGDAIHVFPSPGGQDATGAQENTSSQENTGVGAVAFSPDGPVGTLAVGDADGGTYLWPMAWLGY
jgi:WD40 repeat protein